MATGDGGGVGGRGVVGKGGMDREGARDGRGGGRCVAVRAAGNPCRRKPTGGREDESNREEEEGKEGKEGGGGGKELNN